MTIQTTETLTLALAQLQIASGTVERNRERAREAVVEAATRGADVVALPEIFTTGYFAFDSYARDAEPLDGETISQFQSVAVDHDIAILAGSFVEDLEASTRRGFQTPAESGYANTSVFIDSDGTRRATYRKHHLFGYGSAEQELLTPGETLGTVELGEFVVGMTTCYDLRFPELYRRLVDEGVTLVLVPSAWPNPRVEHWRLLPRARAVENLLYVATINGVGEFDDATLLGRSTVYDPWGTTVAGLGDEAGLVTARLDPDSVESRREEFPALEDRR
jgi:predicted amidohydrolase